MVAGDLITKNWQFEYNGFVFGHGENGVDLISLTGIEDMPELRVSDQFKARAHGSVDGPQYSEDRVINITFDIITDGPESLRQVVDEFKRATPVQHFETPLVFQMPGAGKRQVNARVRRRNILVERNFSIGHTQGTIQFVCTDPRVYSGGAFGLKTMTTGSGTTTGGLTFPHGFPHGFGFSSPGSISVNNAGNVSAPWKGVMTGPLINPILDLAGTTGRLSLNDFTVQEGQTLHFDSANRTVMLNNTASRYSALDVSRWFDLPVGTSTLQLSSAAGSTGSFQIFYRDAYM